MCNIEIDKYDRISPSCNRLVLDSVTFTLYKYNRLF